MLNDSSFFGLTLNELKLKECKLYDVDFRDSDLAHSTMTYCDFTNSLFMNTNLKSVNFSESSNFTINIFNNKLSKAKFSRYEAMSLLDSLDIELID